jgi:hypothetical protein
MDLDLGRHIARFITHTTRGSIAGRLGRFRSWPDERLALDAPLALAEERTDRLRRIYANATRDVWDGPAVFRDAVARHGGIQLSRDKRLALAHPLAMLMWGELAAWIVSAELAERLEDPDARLAASSQVFDEARHFYLLRDYLALLHVPLPKLDPYFRIAARSLLTSRDLVFKLMAMQIVAEGTAQAIFRFLVDARIEPVLSEILPFIERDEARHVGLGILHLPEQLRRLSPRRLRALRPRVGVVADQFFVTQLRYADHYRAIGAEPRELAKRGDRMLAELGRKLGASTHTGEPFFAAGALSDPANAASLDVLLPPPGAAPSGAARAFRGLVDFGAAAFPN